MYSFSVEMNHIKDGAILLPEDGVLVNITCLALKKDLVLFGDSEGNLTKWNVKTKLNKSICLKRGSELKKLKFAPGKENLLLFVQFADLIQILEVNNLELFSELKTNNVKIKILDSYWCSSDKILVYFSDLSIKVFNVNFKQLSSRIECFAPSLFRTIENKKETNLLEFKFSLLDKIDRFLILKFISQQPSDYLSEGLKDLFEKLFGKVYKNKIEKFACLSAYLNLNNFETKFWTLFSYLLANDANKAGLIKTDSNKFRFILKQNSFLSSSNEFRSNEFELLQFYRTKQASQQQSNTFLKDYLLFNQLDLVFNLLMETDSLDENYTNNLIKYI